MNLAEAQTLWRARPLREKLLLTAGVIGAALAERLASHDNAAAVDAALDWAQIPGNGLLTLADADYPQALLDTADPPVLLYFKAHQRLGKPGLKTSPIEGSLCLNIEMPTNVSGFKGAIIPVSDVVRQTLPADTSFAQVNYTNSAGAAVSAVAVMMLA